MVSRISSLQRFFYSHHFFGGLRQAVGILTPAIVLAGWFELYQIGVIAAMGATCVAIIDEPSGPRRYRRNEMLGGVVLGSLTVLITGLASSHPIQIWITVPLLCFSLSMLSVFGKRGGLIGFACLLLMTVTMRVPLQPNEVVLHTLYSLGGGLFYFAFSSALSRLLWFRETQLSLSAALFATADYLAARARFYDIEADLDESYRALIKIQAAMTEKHQTARDMVLRELPRGHGRGDRHRVAMLNIFTDMVDVLDNLVATQTDYVTLRRQLPDSDILVFTRDALYKLSEDISRVALTVARNKRIAGRNSAKAEIRAMEYELEKYQRRGLAKKEPEVYALLVQILRRVRNVARLVQRMAEQTDRPTSSTAVDLRLNKSLSRFLSSQETRFGLLTSNLRLDSSHFRYAVRVAIAAMLGMTVPAVLTAVVPERHAMDLTTHNYWIILTIVVVMKPGFAATRQRNGWRLMGTFVGCGLALALFQVTSNIQVYLAILIASSILGNSLVQVNFRLAAVFNTLFVLIVFHFISPGTSIVIGERLVDTIIGCSLALVCSYILPWWETNYMAALARAAKTANQRFFATGMRYAELNRALLAATKDFDAVALATPAIVDGTGAPTLSAVLGQPVVPSDSSEPDTLARPPEPVRLSDELSALRAERDEAFLAWRLARKSVHIAFANFAQAFYRMMNEPVAHQRQVPQLNSLLLQNHVLASQISAAIPILATLDEVPPGIQKSMEAIGHYLNDSDASAPASVETEGELAALVYPLRQMVKAAQLIRNEMRGVSTA